MIVLINLAVAVVAPNGVTTTAAMPRAFLGRYEAARSDCAIPLSRRDDDETGQGGALFLITKRSLHFVEFDWPVKSVTTIGPREVEVRYVNDVDADGRKLVVETARFKLAPNLTLSMIRRNGTQRYYRC